MSLRVAQALTEVLQDASDGVAVTQSLIEVLQDAPTISPATPTGVGVSSTLVEVLQDAGGEVRVSQSLTEVLQDDTDGEVRVSQSLTEVLQDAPTISPTTPTGVGVSQSLIEVLQDDTTYVGAGDVNIVSGAFSVNGICLAAIAGGFAASAVIRAPQQPGSFTVDARLMPFFRVSALVLGTVSNSTRKVDAAIVRRPTGSFTVDAVRKSSMPSGFTANAMFSRGHYTLDAWLWVGDANIEVSQTGLEAAWTGVPNIEISQAGYEVAYEKPRGTWTVDAVLVIITHPEGSFTLDARIAGHFLVDAWLWTGNAGVHVSQAGLEAAWTGVPNIEISQAGYEIAYERPRGAWTVDAVLAIITHPEGSFTLNARIAGHFLVDAWLWTGNAGVHVSQFGIERARTNPSPLLHVSQAGIEVARTGWNILWVSQSGYEVAVEKPKGTFAADANVLRTGEAMTPATFTIDYETRFVFTSDAAIIGSMSSTFAASAAVVRRIEGHLYLDANICLGMDVDAIVRRTQAAVFNIFACKIAAKTTSTGAFTLDAFRSGCFTVSAWVTRPVTFTVGSAIIEAGKYLKSLYADAVVTSPARGGEFLVEAEIWNQRTVVYEGEGASHVDRNLITERLDFPGFPNPIVSSGNLLRDDCNNLYGPFYPIDMTPVTITLWDFPDYDGTRSLGIHSDTENMWVWPDEAGVYEIWPSYHFEQHYVYTWKGNAPFDPTLEGSGMVSYYRDDTVVDALPAPTLDAWLVGTPGEPFTLDAEIIGREKTRAFSVAADLMKAGEQRSTFSAGAHLLAPRELFFYIFATVAPLHFSADAIISQPSFTLDAHIHLVGGADAVFTLDATVKATVAPVSTYGKGPTLDAEIVRHTHTFGAPIDADIRGDDEGRGWWATDAVIKGMRTNPFRIYLAALVIPDVSFTLDAYIGHFATVDAWIGSTGGGLGSFAVGAYVRGSSFIVFPEDGGSPTNPFGGPPALSRKFGLKIEAFIPDPIPIGNDAEIERLISLILEAEAELDAMYCAVTHYSSQGYPVAGGSNSGGGGYTGSLPPAIAQAGYPGGGDIDDCWVIADVWTAVASGQSFRPTVTQYRRWANNPDRPGPTGGSLDHSMRAARSAWPSASIRRYHSSDWDGFTSLLKAGWSASLSVEIRGLPSSWRYGPRHGHHRIGVVYQNGSYYYMDPNQSNGSAPRSISGYELRNAARAHSGGTIGAVMFR